MSPPGDRGSPPGGDSGPPTQRPATAVIEPTSDRQDTDQPQSTAWPVRRVELWTTVGLTALPGGWRNCYAQDNGGLCWDPAPALLLQECRSVNYCQHGQAPVSRPCAPPYATRVVFAAVDTGELLPACETSNYCGSTAPGVDPATDRDIADAAETYLILQALKGESA